MHNPQNETLTPTERANWVQIIGHYGLTAPEPIPSRRVRLDRFGLVLMVAGSLALLALLPFHPLLVGAALGISTLGTLCLLTALVQQTLARRRMAGRRILRLRPRP